MTIKNRRVSIRQEEMETIFNLKSVLNQKDSLASCVEKYCDLGWTLQAVNGRDGADLKIDFQVSPETWGSCLWEADIGKTTINLGVRTGTASHLLVLDIIKGPGEAALDRYGPWRAECIATLGMERELHFYTWNLPAGFDLAVGIAGREIMGYGEGQAAPVPPSLDPETLETWRWLSPPWECPPQSPSESLLSFLRQHFNCKAHTQAEIDLSWQEAYCLASPHEPLLAALSASSPSVRHYYQGIIQAAAAVGINSPEVTLSLLKHAPRGDVRQHPEIWDDLKKALAQAGGQPEAPASPGAGPWEMFLDNLFTPPNRPGAGRWGQPQDKVCLSRFFQRRLEMPSHPIVAERRPFSSIKKHKEPGEL
jgi:hypothetical protein